jgi:26S proteasome regulatory subunit N8
MLLVYLSSLIRSIIALHNLIMNKIQNSDAEKIENNSSSITDKKLDKGSSDKSTTNGQL